MVLSCAPFDSYLPARERGLATRSYFALSITGAGAIKTLFFAEMVFSPIVAAIALLVPVAAHWGAFEYVPAALWLGIFVQCLFTFRWRGLWFLLGPPLAFLAIEGFLVAAPAVRETTGSSPPKSAVSDDASASSVSKPMITQNPDGTFTTQKEPPDGNSKDARAKEGLVIPPQVVVPEVPLSGRTH
jgi:hypothetical protein